VEKLVLSANGDVQRFATFGLPVVQDLIGEGPLAGLLAGMRWSETNLPAAKFIVSVASDTPFFPRDLVERLSEGCGRDENTVALSASTAGTHPVFGLWPIKLADGLEKFLKSGVAPKVLAFADRFMRLNVPFDDIVLPNGDVIDPFFNVNTPEDLARAKSIVAALEGHGAESLAAS
jgi:molybdopterin-guanine dinucleotide biosynthesis protein A